MLQANAVKAPLKAIVSHDQLALDAMQSLQTTVLHMGDLRKSISSLEKFHLPLLPDMRQLKVHKNLRTNGKKPTIATPELVLRGNWLEKAGFSFNEQWVHVIALDEMIIIFPKD